MAWNQNLVRVHFLEQSLVNEMSFERNWTSPGSQLGSYVNPELISAP